MPFPNVFVLYTINLFVTCKSLVLSYQTIHCFNPLFKKIYKTVYVTSKFGNNQSVNFVFISFKFVNFLPNIDCDQTYDRGLHFLLLTNIRDYTNLHRQNIIYANLRHHQHPIEFLRFLYKRLFNRN